ncbi:hypothetical protein Tco_0541176 [Tanacetum coccineum]
MEKWSLPEDFNSARENLQSELKRLDLAVHLIHEVELCVGLRSFWFGDQKFALLKGQYLLCSNSNRQMTSLFHIQAWTGSAPMGVFVRLSEGAERRHPSLSDQRGTINDFRPTVLSRISFKTTI